MHYEKDQQSEYYKLSIAPTPPLLFSQPGHRKMEADSSACAFPTKSSFESPPRHRRCK
jgi:hypothetical protein